jgi:N-acetylmuramoyl-L-alanine amidase
MPVEHVTTQGETIASIALEFGFFPDTIWNDSANAELKRKRQDPHVLLPGDVVVIPEKRLKKAAKPDQARHRFRRKGVPKVLRIRLLTTHGPLSNMKYRIDIDGRLTNGKTDADGVLKETIPLNAKHAKLMMENGRDYEIALGEMDPINEIVGIQKRLANVGSYGGPFDGQLGPETIAALRSFQASQGLPITGEADDATKNRLRELNDLPAS